MAAAWQTNMLARPKATQRAEPKPQAICTGCLSAVAISTLSIRISSRYGIDPEALLEQMKRFPNWGASILPRFVDTRPTSDSTRVQEYVDIEMFIKLKSGKAQPVHIIAGWDDSDHCYLPLKIGMPRASFDRPIFLL
ncbi:MAG TPA: hypothetical protein VG710_14085 [Opitutus sp.]|nr:hypothetical protein [Opitutus sp.]